MVDDRPIAAEADIPDRAGANECVEAMGYAVFNRDLSAIPLNKPCSTVQTINPIAYGTATRDTLFRDALQHADWLCLDGVYLGLAPLLLKGRSVKPNQGPDIFYHFMRRLNESGGRVFFMGASDSTLAKMKARAAREYPNVAVGTYSPPFKPDFSEEDNNRIIAAINEFRPDVVFTGMTNPKQEKWGYVHRDRLDACLVIAVGAVFDWFAGTRREIAPIWWKLRLGWLIRLADRPELIKRYPMIALFFWHLALARVGIKLHPKPL